MLGAKASRLAQDLRQRRLGNIDQVKGAQKKDCVGFFALRVESAHIEWAMSRNKASAMLIMGLGVNLSHVEAHLDCSRKIESLFNEGVELKHLLNSSQERDELSRLLVAIEAELRHLGKIYGADTSSTAIAATLALLFVVVGVAMLFRTVNQPQRGNDGTVVSENGFDPGGSSASGSKSRCESHLEAFFPLATGATWSYDITVAKGHAYIYEETMWPLDNGRVFQSSGGRRLFARPESEATDSLSARFPGLVVDMPKTGRSYELTFTAKQHERKDNPLFEGLTTFDVEIREDELDIFHGASTIVWGIDATQDFIFLILLYDLNSIVVPRSALSLDHARLAGPGVSRRLVCLGGNPGREASVPGSSEKVSVVGIEVRVPGYEGKRCLHLRREALFADSDAQTANSVLVEDSWFAEGMGLVRTEQKVDGEQTYAWNLTSFVASAAIK